MPTRIAIIHDWLVADRGGEKVLEAIAALYPDADIFTLFYRPEKAAAWLQKRRVVTSKLNRLPGSFAYYRYLLPLLPLAIESFDLNGYDLIISSSHCVAKGIIPPPGALHLCYCHTPMRYAWDKASDYFKPWQLNWIAPFLHYLRQWDVTSSARVDQFLANSAWVAKRIEKYYRRSSEVVFPFADLGRFSPSPSNQNSGEPYYLIVSGFAPYKRIDLAITACQKLNRRLVIVGEGQDNKRLRAMAKGKTEFVGRAHDLALLEWYRGARALLFPGEEDFGIAPLEAMACGTPVIAFGSGGVTETVIAGETGLFFDAANAESLASAIVRFESTPPYSKSRCQSRAREFSRNHFQQRLQSAVQKAWAEHTQVKSNALKNFQSPVTPIPVGVQLDSVT